MSTTKKIQTLGGDYTYTTDGNTYSISTTGGAYLGTVTKIRANNWSGHPTLGKACDALAEAYWEESDDDIYEDKSDEIETEENIKTLLSDCDIWTVSGQVITAKAGYTIAYVKAADLYKITANDGTESTPKNTPKSEPKSEPKCMDDVRYFFDYCGFIRKEVPEWAHLIHGATSAFVVDSRVTGCMRAVAVIFVDAANKEVYRHVGTVEGVYPAPTFLSSILEALTNNFGDSEKRYIKDENDRYLYVVERRQSGGFSGWFFGTLIPIEYEYNNPYPVGKRAKAMRIALENNKHLGWCPTADDQACARIKANPPAGAGAGNALAKIVELFGKK